MVGRTVLRLRALDVPAAAGFTNMPVSVDVLDAIGGRSRRLRLPYHELIVGSRKDIEGSLDDRHVSGRHCAIQRRRSGAVVRDLESRNGTFVFVRPGDFVPFDAMVVIGRSTYRVRRGPAPSLHRRGQ